MALGELRMISIQISYKLAVLTYLFVYYLLSNDEEKLDSLNGPLFPYDKLWCIQINLLILYQVGY